MAATLEQLRRKARNHLGIAGGVGGAFPDDVLDEFLNYAYRELLTEVQRAHPVWAIAATPITIAVTPANREYLVATGAGVLTDQVAKILDLARVETNGRTPIPFTTFAERNTQQLWSTRGRAGGEAYVYRATEDGLWRVGFVAIAPTAMTVEVRYSPKLVPMVGPGDVPLMIPDVLHEMIPVRAAIVAKVAENRDVAGLAALDARLYAQAMKELSDPTSSGGHSF